ncbi:hypothetical protein B0H10DRAFT_1940605 [Mycena sp. CBHHK59/15]|nr:hypothetical protein B0H10DRAFT_1940605 [Mycena sp. CBHHK59/15]
MPFGISLLHPHQLMLPLVMPAAPGPLWQFFHNSDNKPNGSHYRETHWRCIDAHRPAMVPVDVDLADNFKLMEKEEWFESEAVKEASCDVLGEKKAMAGHLRHCQHATAEEKGIAASEVPTKADKKATAKHKQEKAVEEDDQADDEAGSLGNGRKKRKIRASDGVDKATARFVHEKFILMRHAFELQIQVASYRHLAN